MAKIKYYYNTETCTYERVKTSAWDVLVNLAGFLILSALFSGLIWILYLNFFDSPKEIILKKENDILKQNYEILKQEVSHANDVLNSLIDRDDNIYRVIFEAKPISKQVRKGGVGGALIDNFSKDKNEIVEKLNLEINKLKNSLYVQSKSYDELVNLVKNKEKMLASIPAIQPISNKELRALASGFGFRIHPIYKVRKFHTGIDFSAVRGTPVYATGDGIATIFDNVDSYGKMIEINHGYGFVTRYAHLEKFKVKSGQKVKRGETIGYVGSTGTSTAPHLHYEVIRNGVQINPINYFFNDLSPKEYEELLKLAEVENQSLGGGE
jgi:murein DD-endopeptidase MepM/ murein hydrolase activator NlpD